MCAKHVAERPRRRVRRRALVTVAVLVAAFAFLTWLADFDARAEARGQAQARASVALASWHPGEDHAPVLQEMQALADSGIADADTLRTLTAQWDDTASPTDTEALTRAVDAAGASVAAELRAAHRTGSLILAVVLIVVAGCWFAWFRRSVRRQREVTRGVTERTAVDAGERRLLALVRNSTDVVAIIGPDSTATFLSPAIAVLGWSPDELTGRALLDIVSPQDLSLIHI